MADAALDTCLSKCSDNVNSTCVSLCLSDEGYEVAKSSSGGGIPLAASLSLAPVLLLLSAMFSGLTLGLLSLDMVSLKVLESAGDPKEREYAERILPLRKHGNLLLCTLLLGNTLVNNALSILLADLTTGFVGLVVSVFLVLIFGEIIPQAVCSRYGLKIGSHARWALYFFRALFFPAAYPLAFILDKALGRDIGQVYSLEEIKRLLELHATDPVAQAESGLTSHDHLLLLGALEYKHKRVKDVMTGIESCFMLEAAQHLNFATMLNVYRSGFTRIPVYRGDRKNVVGVLYAKDLILVDPEDEIEVSTILSFRDHHGFVDEECTLDRALQKFLASGNHMLLVYGPTTKTKPHERDMSSSFSSAMVGVKMQEANESGSVALTKSGSRSRLPSMIDETQNEVKGIITLEDILEELIKTEILDESDQWEDVNMRVPRRIGRRDTRDLETFLASFEKNYQVGRLGSPEVAAIAAFLSVNVPEFSEMGRSDASMKGLIRSAILIERSERPDSMTPGAPPPGGEVSSQSSVVDQDSSLPQSPRSGVVQGGAPFWDADRWEADEELHLYRVNAPSDKFTLILQGRILVHTSAEGFSFELGPWSVLGNKALSDDAFVADFDAVAIPPCRLLRITRASYRVALRAARVDTIVGARSLRREIRRERDDSVGPEGTSIELASIPEASPRKEIFGELPPQDDDAPS